jgi:hypothetical protein
VTGELVVIKRLLATSAVTAIVVGRIYKVVLPQSPTLPAIVVQVVSDPRSYHLRGTQKLCRTRVQVDAYVSEVATTAAPDPGGKLTTLEEAIDGALNGQAFTVGSPVEARVSLVTQEDRRHFREAEELRQLRTMLDYAVWWKVATS